MLHTLNLVSYHFWKQSKLLSVYGNDLAAVYISRTLVIAPNVIMTISIIYGASICLSRGAVSNFYKKNKLHDYGKYVELTYETCFLRPLKTVILLLLYSGHWEIELCYNFTLIHFPIPMRFLQFFIRWRHLFNTIKTFSFYNRYGIISSWKAFRAVYAKISILLCNTATNIAAGLL